MRWKRRLKHLGCVGADMYENCLAFVKNAAPKLTQDEVEFLMGSLGRKAAFYEKRGISPDQDSAMLKAVTEFVDAIKIDAVIKRRNAVLNLEKRNAKLKWAKETFGTRVSETIETILVGTNRAKEGARSGVMQMQTALYKHYLSGFAGDLVKGDLHAIFASGVLDREAARALWSLGKPDEAQLLAKLPKEAVELAKIINKWQEVSRLDANKEGAWIGKLDGYIVRQSHDPYRITIKGGVGGAEWKADAIQWFDLEKMLAEQDVADTSALLGSLYTDLSSGNHMKSIPDESGGFTGTQNLAKKISKERVIHFKDSDAWFDYNQKYGTGNLRESVASGLRHSAQTTGLMKVLGTNPANMIDRIENDLVLYAKQNGDEHLARFRDERKVRENYMKAVDGTMNVPIRAVLARRMANIRGFETIIKLGTMIVSQFNDIPIYGAAATHDGRGFFSAMGESITHLGKGLKSKEKMDLFSSLDVFMESTIGELGRTGSFNEAGGMSNAVQLFMKLNLSQWWSESIRSGAQASLSHYMARQKGKAFGSLEKMFSQKLTVYKIKENEWNVIRKLSTKTLDFKEYITADNISQLPDSDFHKIVTDQGLKITPRNIAEARKSLEDNLRNYFIDRAGFYLVDPDAKTKALMLGGLQAGDGYGEAARFMAQFKSFTGSFMQKTLGQELYGRGFEGYGTVNALKNMLKNGNGEMTGFVRLITMMTLMGYVSLTVKDLLRNKTPRDLSDPSIAYKTFLAALVQGGGMGLMGDFLFSESSRMGSSTLGSIAGPFPSDAAQLVDLYHRALRGDDTAAHAFNVFMNTAVPNLLGSRTALQYLAVNDVQEWLNHGYLNRTENRMEREFGQSWLVRPQ